MAGAKRAEGVREAQLRPTNERKRFSAQVDEIIPRGEPEDPAGDLLRTIAEDGAF